MGWRRETRADFILQVRVLGMSADNRPFNESVQTLNISRRGVVLTGVQSQLKVGEIVGLRYGEKRARYRVAWVQRPDPSQAACEHPINSLKDLLPAIAARPCGNPDASRNRRRYTAPKLHALVPSSTRKTHLFRIPNRSWSGRLGLLN